MYILQNALKKPTNITRKFSNSTHLPELDHSSTNPVYIQDRSDNGNSGNFLPYYDADNYKTSDPELRSQNIHNFKLRKRVLKSVESNTDESPAESKQLFDNHAAVYRVRQR